MKRVKRLFSLAICSVMAAAMFIAIAPTAQAEELTQIRDSSKITYKTVSAEDQQMLRKVFIAEDYKYMNHDVLLEVGDNPEVLFSHFINYGIWEGRSACIGFNVDAYASAYPDLKAQYGNDILAYYRHYVSTKDTADRRPITTLSIAEKNNVTVTSLIDSDLVLTPSFIRFADYAETNYYADAYHGFLVDDRETRAAEK